MFLSARARLIVVLLGVAVGGSEGLGQPTSEPPPGPSGDDAVREAGGASRLDGSPNGVEARDPPRSDVYKPIGPQLFPLYQHHLRTRDDTKILSMLYVFRSTSNPQGDWSRLALPFFYRSHTESPPEEHLQLYPLLYFHKSSESESYNYALPFYFDHRTPEDSLHLLVPFWKLSTRESGAYRRHEVPPLYPLFSHTRDVRDEEVPVTSHRFGLWRILDLWSKRNGPDTFDRRALEFFNWGETARGPLAAYLYSWVRYGDEWRGRTHLFPFYWNASEPGYSYTHLVPFYFSSVSPERSWNLVLPFWWNSNAKDSSSVVVAPFYGNWRSSKQSTTALFPLYFQRKTEDSRSLFLFPLLSGGRSGPGDQWSLSLLWPLFHYADRGSGYSVASFPFFGFDQKPTGSTFISLPFDRSVDGESNSTGVFLWLYRTNYVHETGKRTHSILYPLGNYDVEPDGSRGDRWLFPYYETFNEQRRWRIVLPLYYEKQNLVGGETDTYFQLGLPLYFSWGQVEDYFSVGFPLYWAGRTGPRGWRTFLPLFYQSYDATSHGLHFVPFYSQRSFPSREQRFFGGPLYIYERQFDIDREIISTGHYPLWPLFGVRYGKDNSHLRVLPLFWTSRDGEQRDLLATPLLYAQWGGDRRQFYFFPLYGAYRTEALHRDLYALGSFIRTKRFDDEGTLTQTSNDVLWKLASFQNDIGSGSRHSHILPLLYWNTRTPAVDRTIAGPFYYGHRILDDRREHRLNMFLGNLWFSKVTEEFVEETELVDTGRTATIETAAADIGDTAAGDPGGDDPGGDDPAGDDPAGDATGANSAAGDAEGERAVAPAVDAPAEITDGDATPPKPESPGENRSPPANDEDGGNLADETLPDDGSVTTEENGGGTGALFPLGQRPSQTEPAMSSPAPTADAIARTPKRRLVRSDKGVLWPLSRSYKDPSAEREGFWTLPFYFDLKDRFGTNFAIWPFYFRQRDKLDYTPTYFRYLFLFNRETWSGGHRTTFGQILFDWRRDTRRDTLRWRFLYPLIESEIDQEGYRLDLFDPLVHFESREGRGERSTSHRIFPILWQGSRDRQVATGEWEPEERHFFVLPLFGVHARTTRTDYYALFPLIHVLKSQEASNWEVWPFFFRRNEPGLEAFRFWPLHASETGESGGRFWVSRYLFLSKYFSTADTSEYRLDPLLFDYRSTPDTFSTNALFHLFSYDRAPERTAFHAFPLAFGKRTPQGAFNAFIPLFYGRHFGERPIDYADLWRFVFLTSRLEGGDGERYTSILGWLFENTSNPNRPNFHERRLLRLFYVDRATENSRQFEINPLFSYYRNDDDEDTRFSALFSLYQFQKLAGVRKHTFLYFLSF